MSKFVRDVRKFHERFKTPVVYQPKWPTDKRVQLRVDLVNEEVNKELLPAIEARDMVATADAIADAIYVLIGTALEFGIPLDAVWKEVQRANMAKSNGEHRGACAMSNDPCFCGSVKYREDGKVLKPEGWQPPDIERVLIG